VLRAPTGSRTRPTADRVREAIFDMLGSLVELRGVTVADLFAGSGAMGIEALSRGARAVVFVDRASGALRVVRSNLVTAGFEDAPVSIVRADVVAWLSRPGDKAHGSAKRFDLALCDPPFAFVAWGELLRRLDAGIAVLESNRPLEMPDNWKVIRHKRYGGTLVTVVSAAGTQPSGGSYGDDSVRSRAADLRTTPEMNQRGAL
jgi:16S rRNA (guanine966-N2)-methyltransferase